MSRLRQIVDAISMLPDVEHHAEGRAAVLEELGCDVAWKRATRKRTMPRFYAYDGDDDRDDEYEPEPLDDQRREHRRYVAGIQWLEWVNPLMTRSFDAMLRAAYPPEAIAQMALRSNPFVATVPLRDVDTIEMRMRSYAHLMIERPQPDVLYLNPITYRQLAERYGNGHRRKRLASMLSEALR